MKTRIGVAGVCLLLIALLVGCADMNSTDESRRRDERRQANRHGHEVIGPAAGYDSHVEPGEGRPGGGERGPGYNHSAAGNHFGSVQLIGYRVRPTASPVIDQFKLSLYDVQYRSKPFHVISVGDYAFTAQVKDDDVNNYLNRHSRTGNIEMHDIHMTFTPRQVRMTAIINIHDHNVIAVSTGALKQDGAARIIYVPDLIVADDAPLPVDVQQDILQQINPVADLSSLHCAPRVQQITCGDGSVIMNGTAALKHLP